MLVRLSTAVERVGIGRSRLYELASKHPGLFRKFGARTTLVDTDMLDSILSEAPAADIKVKSRWPEPEPSETAA